MRTVRGTPKAWSKLKRKSKMYQSQKMKCYNERKENLSELGYTSYSKYLESDEWKNIRNTHLERYQKCLLCGELATQVHHMEYDCATLLGHEIHKLVQLCNSCHEHIEFDENGSKNTLHKTNEKLYALAKLTVRGTKWIAWQKHREREAVIARKKAEITNKNKAKQKHADIVRKSMQRRAARKKAKLAKEKEDRDIIRSA